MKSRTSIFASIPAFMSLNYQCCLKIFIPKNYSHVQWEAQHIRNGYMRQKMMQIVMMCVRCMVRPGRKRGEQTALYTAASFCLHPKHWIMTQFLLGRESGAGNHGNSSHPALAPLPEPQSVHATNGTESFGLQAPAAVSNYKHPLSKNKQRHMACEW